MASDLDLIEFVKGVIIERGKPGVERAIGEILRSETHRGKIFSALKYFTRVTVAGGLPIFPALVSLSNEAAGGEKEKTIGVGAAIAMLTWAADIHDDIIDISAVKYSKKTVYGKFGTSIALLAGDALLIQGSILLAKECESLDEKRKRTIQDLIQQATFEIGNVEAEELALFKKLDTTPQEYRKIVRLKAIVPEAMCRIGAILASADHETVETLGHYGRIFGIASTFRDEFADVMEHQELQNRLTNEVPPFPIICAKQNPELKNKIKPLLENRNLALREVNRIVKIILGSEEAQTLRQELNLTIDKELKQLKRLLNNKAEKELTSLLLATRTGI